MTKWTHKATTVVWRGKTRITCICGWMSRTVPADQAPDLTADYIKHTGLIEVHKKEKTDA